MHNAKSIFAGALTDGRKALKWGTDYFLKAHTATNEFYGQVGQGDADHAYWGRPEDMTMARPAYKIDTSKPGKLTSHSFFHARRRHAKCTRHPRSTDLPFQHISNLTHFLAFLFRLAFSVKITALCSFKAPTWPLRQPPHSLLLPSPTRVLTPLIPTTWSPTQNSFSISPTNIAANTATPSPTPRISTRKCNTITFPFRKCNGSYTTFRNHQHLNSVCKHTWLSYNTKTPPQCYMLLIAF